MFAKVQVCVFYWHNSPLRLSRVIVVVLVPMLLCCALFRFIYGDVRFVTEFFSACMAAHVTIYRLS